MSLPTYDKSKRTKTFQQLPKGAYVIKIMDAKQDQWPSGGDVIRIAFDIAEGEYKGFYQKILDNSTNEDKKWPMDAVFNLDVPTDKSETWVWTKWNTFFADLEDSNNGFVFSGDLKTLRGKIVGGLFHNKQSKGNDGTIYDHIVMRWSRVADDIRNNKYGKLPKDKLIEEKGGTGSSSNADSGGFTIDPVAEAIPW